jgi:threonine aldolase
VLVDECAAPERFIGCQLLPLPAPDGRLEAEAVRHRIRGLGVPHHPPPAVVSLTQATEYGTVYTPDQVSTIAELAHAQGLLVHMDGARLANAVASLGVSVADITWRAGVDLLSFGGTKNGLLSAEAVVFFDRTRERADRFPFIRKQGMGLSSKMRFVAAQFEALLTDGRWLASAAHANAMAQRLAAGVEHLSGLTITRPVEANAVFARLPRRAIERLQEEFLFYVWDEATDEVRWMTSFDTSEAQVDTFVAAIGRELGPAGQGNA